MTPCSGKLKTTFFTLAIFTLLFLLATYYRELLPQAANVIGRGLITTDAGGSDDTATTGSDRGGEKDELPASENDKTNAVGNRAKLNGNRNTIVTDDVKSFSSSTDRPSFKNPDISVAETTATAAIVTGATTTTKPETGVSSPPNIVYMLADDLGYGDVAYNGAAAHTPNIDAMASGPHSIRFDRFYSGGPTCSPTRGTLLTGRNHNRYCIWHADLGVPPHDLTCPSLMPLPPSELTVAEVLSEAGYHTAIYGKWHVGDLKEIPGGNRKWPVSNPTTHGFREWLVTERHTSNILPNCKCSVDFPCMLDGRKYNVVFCRSYWYKNPLTGKLEKSKRQVFEDSHFLVDRFEEFLKRRNTSRPFYVQLSFHAVHSQYLATPHWRDVYIHKYGEDRGNYLGATSSLDEAVGRVRLLLVEHGIADNTLLWFSSDNGPQKGEPGSAGKLRGRKGKVLEGGIRVPGIIEWPAVIHSNRRTSVPIVTTDFLPTVADIVGYRFPEKLTLDGISILPILRDSNGTRRRDNNIKFAFHVKKGKLDSGFTGAVVGDRYKFYAEFEKGKMEIGNYFLYDLEVDSGESRSVSAEHVELTRQMKAELEDFLISVTESATEIGCLDSHDRRDIKC